MGGINIRSFIIKENDSGQRLDKFLSKATPSLPASLMYKYIREKKIKVNKKRCNFSDRLSTGDEITFFIRDEFFEKPTDTAFKNINAKLDIVYEDGNILLCDKAPGIVVHADDKGDITLIDMIKSYLFKKGEYDPENELSFVPSLCNRIDRNTGGIVICAKNAEALRCINEIIKNREISKKYLAIVHGTFENKSGHLKNYLLKDESKNMVDVFDKPRKNALTAELEYTVLKTSKERDLSLIEVKLLTGRTHQIRAQFSHIGHPLLGDGKYGINRQDKKVGYKFQALYAYKLAFLPKDENNPLYYLKNKVFTVKNVFFKNEI